MLKTLVIVESPGKIKKIGEYLGSNYIIKASFGHCRDLDSKTLSIDVDDNFKPNYIIIPDKRRVVKDLKDIASSCKEVILAADEDREGEMIASSLADLLKLKEPKRIVFHEITKKALNEAIKKPTTINYDMVYAQQARRLLDRLVGYKITPILWKHLAGSSSAGRVQSVVVKVIIDKEKEIENSISSPYFKTIGEFNYKKSKLNSVLMKGKDQYRYSSYEKAEKYLNKINKDTEFKVKEVSEKKAEKKASPPFITSTLQQDASTKLHFPVKKTMMVAQKLYEAGMITYMRTDSTNLSKDAMDKCKEYIDETYGDNYSDPKVFKSKSKGAQEAHEAIRPTKLEISSFTKLDKDAERLYSLIWKRTMASQMANAILNIQTIKIDGLNNGESILPKKSLFVSKLETIDFDGFLKLYNTHDSDNEKGYIKIKKDKIVDMKNILVSEEYTKPPYRYNEAGLIKFMDKKGIGRPSTYASIISKVLDRKYVEIKDIKGVKKESRIIKIDSKLKMSKNKKDVVIGKENKKIAPTDMGIKITEFLVKNFDVIMNIDFTAKFEKFLDKIATGKAKWYNILDQYYKMFNPMVVKLHDEAKHLTVNNTDVLLGKHPISGLEIYTGSSKYGPYVKIMEDIENKKWKYAPLKNKKPEDLTIEDAVSMLQYPKFIGKITNAHVYLYKGQFGLYLKMNKETMSIKDKKITEDKIDIHYAKKLFDSGDPYALKTFTIKNKKVHLKKGEYGYYLQIKGKGKKKNKNMSLPDKINPDEVTLENVLEYIARINGTRKKYNNDTD
jgi:DNA topoisomerase I